jgi:hypothetical protein
MRKGEIVEILVDWNFWEREVDTGIPRPEYVQKIETLLGTGQILLLIGVRRAGKSTLLLQFAKHLIKKGINPRDILIVNFEDYRFADVSVQTLKKIYETYLEEVKKGDEKPYIFLDEVQRVKDWERFVRTLHERGDARIIVTGSTSKLMSDEVASVLTGRHVRLFVYPLDFKEFLRFKDFEVRDAVDMAAKRRSIKRLFKEYLEFGGFPRVVLEKEKKTLLAEYFEDVLTKDVVERFRVREITKLKTLARYYITNFSSRMTFNRISKFLDIPLHTVERFSYYLESTGLLHFVKRFSYTLKEQEKAPRKVYCVDMGLINVAGFRFSGNLGRLVENAVYMKLKRLLDTPLGSVYYWEQRAELDFVVWDGSAVSQLIQVCWDVENPETREREVKGLMRAMRAFKMNEGVIITEDYEEEEYVEGNTVKYIPAWKFFLEV